MGKKIYSRVLAMIMSLAVIFTSMSIAPVVAEAKKDPCTHCGGDGFQTCTLCSGSGHNYSYNVMSDDFEWETCPRCHGRGYHMCSWCYGSGNKNNRRTYNNDETTKKSGATKPTATSIVKIASKKKSFTVKWKKKTKNTSGYQIQYSTNSKFKKNRKTRTVKDKTKTALTVKNLKGGKRYYVRVRVYRVYKGKKYYSKWSNKKSVVTKTGLEPRGTSIAKIKGKTTAFTVKWKKQPNKTSGYQIQYSTSSKFKSNKKAKTVKGKNKTAVTVKGLKGGKKYYVRIRTYRVVNGKKYFSKWSKAKSVVTKRNKKPTPTRITDLYSSSGCHYAHADFKWVENCQGYQLQVSQYSDFRKDSYTRKYTCPYNDGRHEYESHTDIFWFLEWEYGDNNCKVISVCLNSPGDNVLVIGKRYFFRIRTFNKVGGKTYYSKWSNVKSTVIGEY
ncbi:MAG: fibronectin type III domain-containing protein [Eubacterium sp.]|nr:fibronectin type III domain-containing protein [Eubacterium sp.]